MNKLIENELLRQRLYRIFHIYEEDYMTTVKLVYIYKWTEKRVGKDVYTALECLFTDWPARKKQQRINEMFQIMQAIQEAHLAAPREASVPYNNRLIGIQKW